jgi:hypothetical protein
MRLLNLKIMIFIAILVIKIVDLIFYFKCGFKFTLYVCKIQLDIFISQDQRKYLFKKKIELENFYMNFKIVYTSMLL